MILIKNKSKKGYLIAKEGDGVDISGRMKYHSGTVKKDIIQTITTKGGNDIGVVVKDDVNLQQKLFKEILNRDLIKPFEIIDYSFVNARFKEVQNNDLKIKNVVNNNCCCTITTAVGNFGICVKDNVEKDLRIRKLTPKETTRLMGFEDSDYNAMKKDLSDMAIYHCCGDSIVVNVLENIFKQMKEQ